VSKKPFTLIFQKSGLKKMLASQMMPKDWQQQSPKAMKSGKRGRRKTLSRGACHEGANLENSDSVYCHPRRTNDEIPLW